MPANYDNVNAVWPDGHRAPTPQEALTGARKLVRLALTLGREGSPPKKYRGEFKLTSGNRRNWTRNGTFYVNPDNPRYYNFRGWKGIVHDISHWAGRRLYADFSPHDARVAFIERKLAEHVVHNGWLDGKLRREPKAQPPVEIRQVRYERTLKNIKTWERKAKRANNALRKLHTRRKYYERELAAMRSER